MTRCKNRFYIDDEFKPDPVDADSDCRCVIEEKADELAAMIRGEHLTPDEMDSLLHNLYEAIFDMSALEDE